MEKMNKQQQIFVSEYCPQEINSREIHLHLTFSSKRNKYARVWKNAKSFLGLVQILELLKKSWNWLSFPALEKVW